MAIALSTLSSAYTRFGTTPLTKSLNEAIASNRKTVFLSHSHKDESLAKGLQVLLKEDGWNVYIDWQDNSMPATTNGETANKIKEKIRLSDWFIFLATENSMKSRWCPWELGYADIAKGYERIGIVQTYDRYGHYYGNEYLQIYKKIIHASNGYGTSGYSIFGVNESEGRFLRDL